MCVAGDFRYGKNGHNCDCLAAMSLVIQEIFSRAGECRQPAEQRKKEKEKKKNERR